MPEQSPDQLESLNTGDKAVMSFHTGFSPNYIKATVIRTTETYIVVRTERGDIEHFDRVLGKRIGKLNYFYPYYLYPDTKRRDLENKLMRTAWRLLPLDKLERICAILDE